MTQDCIDPKFIENFDRKHDAREDIADRGMFEAVTSELPINPDTPDKVDVRGLINATEKIYKHIQSQASKLLYSEIEKIQTISYNEFTENFNVTTSEGRFIIGDSAMFGTGDHVLAECIRLPGVQISNSKSMPCLGWLRRATGTISK